MSRREIPPLHEIAKLELKFKFFYFLLDLGIVSAARPGHITWEAFMHVQSELTASYGDDGNSNEPLGSCRPHS